MHVFGEHQTFQIVVCLSSVVFLFVGLLLLFYITPIHDCEVCKYFNCIPITKDFCADQNIDLRVDGWSSSHHRKHTSTQTKHYSTNNCWNFLYRKQIRIQETKSQRRKIERKFIIIVRHNDNDNDNDDDVKRIQPDNLSFLYHTTTTTDSNKKKKNAKKLYFGFGFFLTDTELFVSWISLSLRTK